MSTFAPQVQYINIYIYIHIFFLTPKKHRVSMKGLKAATIYKPKFEEGDPEGGRKVANGDLITVDLRLNCIGLMILKGWVSFHPGMRC